MIYYSIPYSTEKNIGKYYNQFMENLPNKDDFACFVDGDTIFTTSNYGHIIEKVVSENPEVGCFTCYTNRVGCKWQIAPGVDTQSNDIEYHREFGLSLQTIFGTNCIDVSNVNRNEVMSGVMILLRKDIWEKIGKFEEGGMLGIDNDLHWKIQKNGEKIYLMKGVYIYHWYRWPDPKNKTHLL
jgi:GT2 family glycosyltransferase